MKTIVILAALALPGCAALGQATLGYTHDPWTGQPLPSEPVDGAGWLDALLALVTGNPAEAVGAGLLALTGGGAAAAMRKASKVQHGPSRAQEAVDAHEERLARLEAAIGTEAGPA